MMNNFEIFPIEGLRYDIYKHKTEYLYVIDRVLKDDFDSDCMGMMLQQLEGQLILALHEEGGSIHVMCVSHTNSITAIEFLDFLFGTYGIIKGDAYNAEGKISKTMLKMCMSEVDVATELEYFLRSANLYFGQVDNIYCQTFAKENPEVIQAMKTYVKKPISWACVKSTDIAAPGTVLRIKSLENDAGVNVTCGEDTLIMIGVKGEVYEITKEKFEASYLESMEPLNVFDKFFDSIPEIEVLGSLEYKAIDDLARLCYPRPGIGIKAIELDTRTKVFRSGKPDYFTGKPGDFLAIRPDDLTDIYIIQNEVFHRTYEEK